MGGQTVNSYWTGKCFGALNFALAYEKREEAEQILKRIPRRRTHSFYDERCGDKLSLTEIELCE